MDFDKELEQRVAMIEAILKLNLPKEEGYQKIIMEAMGYSLMAGGKRIRPMLMLETFRLFSDKKTTVVELFAVATEMIHTYSLVHDDLPAMDNDEYRRGRKTTHVVYGEGLGILAGDALLNYAFEIAASAFELDEDLPLVGKAIQVMGRKAGIYGMIGGQVVDIMSEGEPLTLEKVELIHKLKTSALIESAMMIGAILAGASADAVAKIERAASLIGLAFQIQDDILDITSTMEVLGKPVHSDEKNHKTTYVTLVGLEQAKEDVKNYSNEALSILKTVGERNLFLENLVSYLIQREK